MAELPEIEVIRRDLDREVVGKKVKAVAVATRAPVKRHRTKQQFVDLLEGAKLVSVSRRGRYLVVALDTGNVLVVDLGATGRLVRGKSVRDADAASALVTITLNQGGHLRFSDPSGDGAMFVIPADELEATLPELTNLGLDPLDQPIAWEHFGRALLSRPDTKLRQLLQDQSFLVGIGPMYTDEILFGAGLRHDREPSSLTHQEMRRLLRSIVEVTQDAVKHRGASIDGKAAFTDLSGSSGRYQEFLTVWGRDGELCARCRHVIVKSRVGNRYSYACAACQV